MELYFTSKLVNFFQFFHIHLVLQMDLYNVFMFCVGVSVDLLLTLLFSLFASLYACVCVCVLACVRMCV